ncbi:hypothetical protein T265_07238 [Opisthorchis viverrini]|uniref:Leucine Rich repeat-containing domain protein n=1 Tax=Opisthorchis viverrini TaxID=6198 RepID=A0A074ZDQ1_OPIVI|nr:hypothetical protein T265_07238 [Opisthorchis viverrini]KER25303.1 hypothetical protein T265_07238 [Opisthorchis viverrini]
MKLRTLASLNISNNRLQKLPNFHTCFPNLETLEMAGNPLFINDELLDDLAQCEMLRELTLDDNTESTDFSELQGKVSERVPQLFRMNNTDLKKRSSRNTDGMKQCYEHKKQVYDLIERQLAALTSMTAPLQASLDKSFDAVSQLFAKVDEEMEKRTSRALTESVNMARSSVRLTGVAPQQNSEFQNQPSRPITSDRWWSNSTSTTDYIKAVELTFAQIPRSIEWALPVPYEYFDLSFYRIP